MEIVGFDWKLWRDRPELMDKADCFWLVTLVLEKNFPLWNVKKDGNMNRWDMEILY